MALADTCGGWCAYLNLPADADELGRSLTAEEYLTARARVANPQLRDRIDDRFAA